MAPEIKIIGLGGINAYLVGAAGGFVLIDTGASGGFVLIDTGTAGKRDRLDEELRKAGCRPGNLRLIVMTHGDHDHSGNGAYLRDKYGAAILLHQGDSGMVERGDMTWNRKAKPDRFPLAFRMGLKIVSLLSRPGKFETFVPDLYVEDGHDLSPWGLDARVLHLPGHSKGSLGVLTSGGDLFCGDLLCNFGKPRFVFIDDLAEAEASVEKLKGLAVGTVYPGHGKPFAMKQFLARH